MRSHRAKQGMLRATRHYMRRSLYRVADIHAMAGDPLASGQLATIIAARQGKADAV